MDENVVIRASDLDIASILGMGFPKYRYLCFELYPYVYVITLV